MLLWMLAALCCLAAAQPPHGCPKNERRVACVNLCNDCWSRGVCDQPFCEPGCDCLDGHFRDDWGECVPEAWCPTDDLCGANEVYSDCAVPCNSCERRGDCDYICEPGCDCKEAFHRNAAGECVSRDSCPPPISVCPADEVAVECAKPRWCNTCFVRGNCRLANCTRGCDCRPGHYRDSSLRCVPEYKCYAQLHKECGPDEQFYSCMPDCSRRCRTTEACAAVCRPGCFCRPGLLRREDGRCVTAEECGGVGERRCDRPDEEFYDCKPFCAAACANRGRACPDLCVPGCFCRRGTMQRDDGACVPPEQCSGSTTSTEAPGFIFGRRRGGEDDQTSSSTQKESSPPPTKECCSSSSLQGSPPSTPIGSSTGRESPSTPNMSTPPTPLDSFPVATKDSSLVTSKDSSLVTNKDSSPMTTKDSSPMTTKDSSPMTTRDSSPSPPPTSIESTPDANLSSTSNASLFLSSTQTQPPVTGSSAASSEILSAATTGNSSVSEMASVSTESLSASPPEGSSRIISLHPSSVALSPSASSAGTRESLPSTVAASPPPTTSEASTPAGSSRPPANSFLDASATAPVSSTSSVRSTLSTRPANATGKEKTLQTTAKASLE